MTDIFITLVSVTITIAAMVLCLVSLFLEIPSAVTGITILSLTGIAAKIAIQTHTWKWTGTAGILLLIGWVVIYSANIGILGSPV